MTVAVPIVLTGLLVVGCILSILGINSNPKEIGWAIEDSMLWLAQRFSSKVIFGAACVAHLATLAAVIWFTRAILI